LSNKISLRVALTIICAAIALSVFSSIGLRETKASGPLMLKDGPKGSAKANGKCPGPYECDSQTCQRCTPLSVTLPQGAQVVRIECWGTKTMPNPQPTWLDDPQKSIRYDPCDTSYDYSDFHGVTQSSNVVSGTFRNWASGIDRYVELRVYYTLP
jgi:hypothetical protein